MSKIENELTKLAEVKREDGESKQDYFRRICTVVTDLPDSDWDSLSKGAQDWFNDACDAKKNKKEFPDFPDAEKDEPARSSRRRGSSDDEGTKEPAKFEPKKGDLVKYTSKRGKVTVGKFVEFDKGDVGIDDGDKEGPIYLTMDGGTLESGEEPKKDEPARGRRRGGDDEPQEPAEPKVGDTVEIVNMRDKVFVGNVESLDKDNITIKLASGDLEDFVPDRVKSIKVKVSARSGGRGASDDAKDTKDTGSTRRRGGDDAKADDKGDDGKKKRSSNAGGVSVGTRIKELILDDMKASQDDIGRGLKKDGLEFSDATLKMIYGDTHKFLDLLDKRKMLR